MALHHRPGQCWRVALLLLALLVLASAPALAAGEPQLSVLVPALNVRSGPGTGYAIISLLHAGDSVPVIGRHAESGWWLVHLPTTGAPGWVSGSASLVKVSGTTSSVPTLAAPGAPAAPAAPGAPAPVAPPAPPAPAPAAPRSSGLIVFQVASGGPIYSIRPDGAGLRLLTMGIDPALSPDGRQVAFTRWQASTTGALGDVYVINSDGSGVRMVLKGANNPKAPAWSPDGRQLIVSVQQGGFLDVRHVCSNQSPVANAYDVTVTVDENGKSTYCYMALPDPGWGLRVIGLESGEAHDTAHDLHSFSPAWDPANAWHVVYRGGAGLMQLDVNRQVTWPLTTDPNDRSPAFAPDGRKLALSHFDTGHWQIYTMDTAGNARVRLTATPAADNVAPAWSPDGAQLAFLSNRGGPWQLWVMNADGSNQRPLPGLAGLVFQYNYVDERVVTWR